MKKNLLQGLLLFCAIHFFAGTVGQRYLSPDSARKVLLDPKNDEEKFRGLRALDRFYYTTGEFDSSAMFQKEMFAIAKELNLPIRYIGVGEQAADLLPFEASKFIESLFE